jgi:fluoride exporter
VKAWLLVAAGGVVGALSRHFLVGWISRWSGPDAGFPWGVFTVNVAGCFVMGVIIGLAEQTRWISEEVRWLVATGFLGSLTTFSTFGADTFHLWRNGHLGLALANAGGSVVAGLAVLAAGYHLAIWARA